MDQIKTLFGDVKRFSTPKVKKHASERGDLLDYFLSQLNPRRVAAGYPPYDHARLGKMLAGRDTQFLYYLQRVCDDSSNWSATFHTTLNPHKYDKKKV